MKPKLKLLGVPAMQSAVLCVLLLLAASLLPAMAQSSLDFGDAPAPYPTLLSSNGPRHTATGPQLGSARDTENDGVPSALALGDDNNGNVDDEDGVVFVSALVPGQTAAMQVTVFGAPSGARLDAWLDFGADGSWAETVDHIFTTRFVTNGVNTLTFPVPAGAKTGATFARFRISFSGDLNFTGAAANGEVEDYRVGISEAMDFSDAPVSLGTVGGFNYPTLLSQNGARHRVVGNFMLGTRIDSEPDGQPNATATGDDINPSNPDDEDGIAFTGGLVAGSSAAVQVACTMSNGVTGKLNAWVDFNADGDWNDAGEQVLSEVTVRNGTTNLTFAVPGAAAGGTTFARFRLSVNGKIGPTGFAPDGEVEDYQVSITAALDFGDAPTNNYPTLLSQNGARHVMLNNFYLGTKIDGETNGQPDATATGDDINPAGAGDDEDGVLFTSSVAAGQTASVDVYVTLPAGFNGGYLNAWLDFNRDGDWADAGEQIFQDRFLGAGVNGLTFTVPTGASQGSTFARFRLSSARALSFTGLTPDGEVEDYLVNIGPRLDFGDAPKGYPVLLAENGARHTYNPDVFLGFRVDSEPDGQPESAALGDDLVGPDEDGVFFTGLLIPGTLAGVQVRASTTGFLHAWVDFNGNGSWADAGEKVFNGTVIPGGLNSLSFNVPASAKTGVSFARFRFTLQSGAVDFTGLAANGEVEDYRVAIVPDRDRCDHNCEGREYWLTFPGNYAPDADNPARLTLCLKGSAGTAAIITVPGIGFSTNVVIPAAQAIRVSLPRAAEMGDLVDVVTNNGVHVVASAPVSITGYDHARYTTDSFMALHASVLGTEYIVMGFGNTQIGVPPLNGTQFALVASESNTVVTITPSVTTGARVVGVPYNLVLQPGDAYQLRNTNDAPSDLSGTIIKSDKPIAVFGGHQCANVPSSNVWFCDYIVEQLLPVNTWGNDFYTAPLATRTGGDTFRLLSAYDNTTITVNGVVFPPLDRAKFYSFPPLGIRLHITADKPIFVAQYANSGDYDGNPNADPFMLTVQATRHYATSYRICTPTNDFPTNYVHLIVPTASVGTIQIDGVPVGGGAFTVIAGTAYSAAQVLISPGNHLVTGGALFGASVYGWAEYDSYAHPACMYFGDVVPPRVTTSTTGATASVNDYPNTPGFVPTPNVAGSATVQDNCDQEPRTPTQTPKPGTLVPPGVHIFTVSLEDFNGNIGETTYSFTVLDPSPVFITCPSNLVVNCTSNNGAIVNFDVTAQSTYDTNVPVVSTPKSGSFFPEGTTVVTNIATSLAGQSNACSFTVTVVCDNKVRFVRGPNSLTLSWSGIATLEMATDIRGPWEPIASGVTSYVVPFTSAQGYFRLRY